MKKQKNKNKTKKTKKTNSNNKKTHTQKKNTKKKTAHPHLLRAQQAAALPYVKVEGCPGTGSYPAPSPDPTTHSLERAAIVWATLERISGFDPSLEMIAPRYLKFSTSSSLWHFILISLLSWWKFTSEVNSPIWPEFEIVRSFMPPSVNCKFHKDPIKTTLCSGRGLIRVF